MNDDERPVGDAFFFREAVELLRKHEGSAKRSIDRLDHSALCVADLYGR